MTKLEKVTNEILEIEEKIKGMHDNGLKGIMVHKYIKCGREGCKCNQGYKHGPYPHIQYYDDDGILRTIYVRKKQEDYYRKKLEENIMFRKHTKQLNTLYLIKRKLESKHL